MPRKMRVQYPGAMYHVMSRGDQRDDIFLNGKGSVTTIDTHAAAVIGCRSKGKGVSHNY